MTPPHPYVDSVALKDLMIFDALNGHPSILEPGFAIYLVLMPPPSDTPDLCPRAQGQKIVVGEQLRMSGL